MFMSDIAPGLASTSALAIARATGLSASYCGEIKRGERVPHPRWWAALRQVASGEPKRGAAADYPIRARGSPLPSSSK